MIALVLVEMLPEAFARSAAAAPPLVFAGYLAVHLSQHTVPPHFHFGEETHRVVRGAARAALLGLLLHTFFDGVAIASAFLVDARLGVAVFLGIFLHKLPEGVTIASLTLAAGGTARGALLAAGALGTASLAGVMLTDRVAFLVRHGLAIAAGVTLYVAASNLVPEFQGKRGWRPPAALLAGAAAFFFTRALLERLLRG
jgi:ZIP family zinc transporter/zinc and cadmium transporter